MAPEGAAGQEFAHSLSLLQLGMQLLIPLPPELVLLAVAPLSTVEGFAGGSTSVWDSAHAMLSPTIETTIKPKIPLRFMPVLYGDSEKHAINSLVRGRIKP